LPAVNCAVLLEVLQSVVVIPIELADPNLADTGGDSVKLLEGAIFVFGGLDYKDPGQRYNGRKAAR